MYVFASKKVGEKNKMKLSTDLQLVFSIETIILTIRIEKANFK
jgi:hypothetical protein